MKRLTTDTNITEVLNDDGFALMCFLKLKQYEDTGFTPTQVVGLNLRVKGQTSVINALRKELSNLTVK